MRLEPYGLMLLIGLLFILPLLGAQLGIDLNIVWRLVQHTSDVIIDAILRLTGNRQQSARIAFAVSQDLDVHERVGDLLKRAH
jgi:hypothetical protein